MREFDFSKITGFEWDGGNRQKSWLKHHVHYQECEEVFFNKPLWVYWDEGHSGKETRYYALGISDQGRRLFLSLTIRGYKLRVISARDQSRKERMFYEAQTK